MMLCHCLQNDIINWGPEEGWPSGTLSRPEEWIRVDIREEVIGGFATDYQMVTHGFEKERYEGTFNRVKTESLANICRRGRYNPIITRFHVIVEYYSFSTVYPLQVKPKVFCSVYFPHRGVVCDHIDYSEETPPLKTLMINSLPKYKRQSTANSSRWS